VIAPTVEVLPQTSQTNRVVFVYRMDQSTPRFPRRYAQREKLRERWARSLSVSPRPESPHGDRPRAGRRRAKKRKKRSSKASDDKESGSDSNPDSEDNHDSGYNSDSSDARAEYLKQRRAQHEAAGPALSDPCDSTKAMMRAEERHWTQ
jgi:hypothetical protein